MIRGDGFCGITRSEGEWLYVDGPCCFKVTSAGAGRTRLAIKGPKTTKWLRDELLTPEQRQALGMVDDRYVARR